MYAHFGLLSGGVDTLASCDPLGGPLGGPRCTIDFKLEDTYYFPGSGISTFAFGSFYANGIFDFVTADLFIDGQEYRVVSNGQISPIVTLQLGTTHVIKYTASLTVSEGPGFSYNFASANGLVPIAENPPPPESSSVPEPGAFLLCAGGMLAIGWKLRA